MPILLVLTIFLPLLVGVALLLLPNLGREWSRSIALATTVLAFGMSLVTLGVFETGRADAQFVLSDASGNLGLEWVSIGEDSGIRLAFGLDGISLFLYVLTSLLMIVAVFSSWTSISDRPSIYYALLLMLHTGLLGLFASLDVVLFYIFFEFTLIPLFFIIGVYGGSERRRASVTFFIYTLAGSLLTLLGVIALIVVHYQYSGAPGPTFSIPELTAGLAELNWERWTERPAWEPGVGFLSNLFSFISYPQVFIYLLLFVGFAIKVPLFPFHTWLPLAHVEAPTAGSVLLAGVLLKVGGYGFVRFNLGMTPIGGAALYPLMASLAVVGIIYGALTALAQTDVKRLVAYSSVSHMGFIALGLFSMSLVSIDGAIIQMVNHGLTTGALFACVGVLYERYHTREMGRMGGVWKRFPLFAFFLILSALGSAAVPGLNGFVGEFSILAGTFQISPFAAITAGLGIILGAYYILLMLKRLLFGPLLEPKDESSGSDQGSSHEISNIRWSEIAGLTPLVVLIVAIGVYPKPFFDRITPSVVPIIEVAEQQGASAGVVVRRTSNVLGSSTTDEPTLLTEAEAFDRPSSNVQDSHR